MKIQSISSPFLADTWWFGLTKRLSAENFKKLAQLRIEQGFSAIQLVVGIPPEVGEENPNAASEVGFPWTLQGEMNEAYLELARHRIKYLNDIGLKVIVYGGWGHQIKWLGLGLMTEWWLKIIRYLDDLNVMYCLCGEVDLWIGTEMMLLPDKTTDDIFFNRTLNFVKPFKSKVASKLWKGFREVVNKSRKKERSNLWSSVLNKIASKTDKPIIVHTTGKISGFEALQNADLLACNTIQTGHHRNSRNLLWKTPLNLLKTNPEQKIINLEPWYEGIKDNFWQEDQLYAYWVSMIVGNAAYCYGAHGIWNVGDGKFLAHWGTQTFQQAISLITPKLIGLSHHEYLKHQMDSATVSYTLHKDTLIRITREDGQKRMQFFPEISAAKKFSFGKIWLPLEGAYTKKMPSNGMVVVFGD